MRTAKHALLLPLGPVGEPLGQPGATPSDVMADGKTDRSVSADISWLEASSADWVVPGATGADVVMG